MADNEKGVADEIGQFTDNLLASVTWRKRYNQKTDAEKARFWRNFAQLFDNEDLDDSDDPLTPEEIESSRKMAERLRRFADLYERKAKMARATVHLNADPAMTDETREALGAMVSAAVQALETGQLDHKWTPAIGMHVRFMRGARTEQVALLEAKVAKVVDVLERGKTPTLYRVEANGVSDWFLAEELQAPDPD